MGSSTAVIDVLGHARVADDRTSSHVEYILLTCMPSSDSAIGEKNAFLGGKSEARLVQRRYRDFERLHAILQPRARRAGLAMPRLPYKTWWPTMSDDFLAARQLGLHAWLGWVLEHQLWCDELCLFLGVSEQAAASSLTMPVASQTVVVGGGVFDAPQWQHRPTSATETTDDDEEVQEPLTRPSSAMSIESTHVQDADDACVDDRHGGLGLSCSPTASTTGYLTAEE